MSSVAPVRRSPRLAEKASGEKPSGPTPKKNPITERVLYEMREFRDKVYETEFTDIEYPSENTVNVTHINGTRYQIYRNRDFLGSSPSVIDLSTGEEVGDCSFDEWRPCLTSVRWFLMVVTNQ
jgi:hypothetical protein